VKKFELARRALVDLREIWEFASQHSFAVADYLLEEFYQQFQKLAEMPGIGHRRPGLTGQDVLFSAVHLLMAASSYLDRLLDPLTEAFTPKVAAAILELRADSEVEAQIGELRRKANEGILTPDEDADYKDFVEAVDLISIMQAKARRFLVKHDGSPLCG
jgi:plasmid stabilization system protein ParE